MSAHNRLYVMNSVVLGANDLLPCRYVFVYSIHYFFVKTKMTGFFQTAFYFGYTAMFCLGLGIMCGALGYLGSSVFVRRIYRNIKCD